MSESEGEGEDKVSFTTALTKRLIELYNERRVKIECKDDKPGAAKSRKDAWKQITDILNSEGGKFTNKQVTKRWQNIKSKAKQVNMSMQKERKKTGGGAPPPPLSETQQAVLNIVGESKQFVGERDYVESPIGEPALDDGRFTPSPGIPTLPPRLRKTIADEGVPGPSGIQAAATSAAQAAPAESLRQLQKEALLSQIEANKAVVKSCEKFTGVLDQAKECMDVLQNSQAYRNLFANVIVEQNGWNSYADMSRL